ncbi:MAG: DUF3617 domain-containing protein [Pseudomonadota bacterium]|uniref:DUF3617 domain-containing protein n=1 Tax=Rhizorhabdus phycosphaerae TaxID=2711156 RepID=UPI0013EC3449|nr:DUF3617 family protein [Rhizorhabdus phycosphaerae]
MTTARLSIGPASLVAAALTLGHAPPALAEGFAPGGWDHQTTMLSADVPGVPQWVVKMFAGNRKRKSCHDAAELARRPEALLTQDDAAQCTKRRFSMAGGQLSYDTFCTNKRFPDGLLVASKGSYTADSYKISTVSTGMKDGKPVKIVTEGSGHRTGSCKK